MKEVKNLKNAKFNLEYEFKNKISILNAYEQEKAKLMRRYSKNEVVPVWPNYCEKVIVTRICYICLEHLDIVNLKQYTAYKNEVDDDDNDASANTNHWLECLCVKENDYNAHEWCIKEWLEKNKKCPFCHENIIS